MNLLLEKLMLPRHAAVSGGPKTLTQKNFAGELVRGFLVSEPILARHTPGIDRHSARLRPGSIIHSVSD
jgi:hypothetical protein